MNDKKQKTEIEMCNESINWNKKEQYLKEILVHHTPAFIDMDQCHQAAVCIPLLKNTSDGYDVLFEVRAATIGTPAGRRLSARRYGGRRRGAAGSGIA